MQHLSAHKSYSPRLVAMFVWQEAKYRLERKENHVDVKSGKWRTKITHLHTFDCRRNKTFLKDGTAVRPHPHRHHLNWRNKPYVINSSTNWNYRDIRFG